MSKRDEMKEAIYKKSVIVVDIDGEIYDGRATSYESAHDSEDGQATLWIDTNSGDTVALLESEIVSIIASN